MCGVCVLKLVNGDAYSQAVRGYGSKEGRRDGEEEREFSRGKTEASGIFV